MKKLSSRSVSAVRLLFIFRLANLRRIAKWKIQSTTLDLWRACDDSSKVLPNFRLITDASKPSEFKREFDDDPNAVSIPMDYSETISMSCPKCKTGKLVERFSPKYQKPLIGCTNYPACTFFTWDLDVLRNPKRCKACGGFMTLRKGPHGLFYGCMNYPTCKNTMEIE